MTAPTDTSRRMHASSSPRATGRIDIGLTVRGAVSILGVALAFVACDGHSSPTQPRISDVVATASPSPTAPSDPMATAEPSPPPPQPTATPEPSEPSPTAPSDPTATAEPSPPPPQPTATAEPSATPPGAASEVTEWLVTQRFVSVEGPDNCWIRQQRERLTGAVFPDVPMTVTRSNGSITVDSHGFLVTYTGTYSGAEFTATGVMPLPGGGGRGCDDDQKVHHQLDGVSNLSGRFSADDRRMTANEVNSYPLNTGGTATYTWSWEATRED